MKLFTLLFLILMSAITISFGQNSAVGIFENAENIGNPAKSGASSFDQKTGIYTVKGSGYNIWFERDEFYYLFNSIKGDFILTANFEFVGKGVDPHRKVGWMIRESADDQASHISATLHGDGLTVLQWRELRGAYMRDPQDEIFSPKSNYSILQLERAGKTILFRAAHPGEPLQLIGTKEMENLGDEVLAGLFVNSHNPEVVEEAKIWNVRIDQPVSDDYNPYESGFIGCRMEIMNVFDGMRRVIYEKDDRFEAPNWMPDGTKLLFNMDGSLYTIPTEGGEIVKINTGEADELNNDHGISFNNKLLAISSSHNKDLEGNSSAVYVLPLEGGEPKLITQKTPSYWHGWNPNNKEVAYVARRGEKQIFNIYKANINDGIEVPVTKYEFGLADGPEYSPDGKYIYYNGNQSGTMQICRMKPDGSDVEQLTFDQYNNWFPHISPDGKWIVYISFPESIPVNDHPSYKRVTLNLMPVSGGAPKVIAYLYGGQGTINVPSWSPDSKHIAFVSNSGTR
jgi:TolB protein